MEITLQDRARIVARAFYRRFDDYRLGHEYWVQAVYEDTLVAEAWHEDKFYRVGYTFDPDADHGQDFDDRVTFGEPETWQEVTWEWVPVERSILREQKRELLAADQADDLQARGDGSSVNTPAIIIPDPLIRNAEQAIGTSQVRTYQATIRRNSDRQSGTVTINTAAVDSYRTIIEPEGMNLDVFYERFFINHDAYLLAGTSPTPALRGGTIQVILPDDNWDHEDPEIERWFSKYVRGLLNRASIGFAPLDGHPDTIDGQRIYRYTEWQLREWSFTPMASNFEAVAERIGRSGIGLRSGHSLPSEVLRRLDHIEQLQNQNRTAPAAPDGSTSDSAQAGDGVAPEVPVEEAVQTVRVSLSDLAAMKRKVEKQRADRAKQTALLELGKI